MEALAVSVSRSCLNWLFPRNSNQPCSFQFMLLQYLISYTLVVLQNINVPWDHVTLGHNIARLRTTSDKKMNNNKRGSVYNDSLRSLLHLRRGESSNKSVLSRPENTAQPTRLEIVRQGISFVKNESSVSCTNFRALQFMWVCMYVCMYVCQHANVWAWWWWWHTLTFSQTWVLYYNSGIWNTIPWTVYFVCTISRKHLEGSAAATFLAGRPTAQGRRRREKVWAIRTFLDELLEFEIVWRARHSEFHIPPLRIRCRLRSIRPWFRPHYL
jgi:hypothetical protein